MSNGSLWQEPKAAAAAAEALPRRADAELLLGPVQAPLAARLPGPGEDVRGRNAMATATEQSAEHRLDGAVPTAALLGAAASRRVARAPLGVADDLDLQLGMKIPKDLRRPELIRMLLQPGALDRKRLALDGTDGFVQGALLFLLLPLPHVLLQVLSDALGLVEDRRRTVTSAPRRNQIGCPKSVVRRPQRDGRDHRKDPILPATSGGVRRDGRGGGRRTTKGRACTYVYATEPSLERGQTAGASWP